MRQLNSSFAIVLSVITILILNSVPIESFAQPSKKTERYFDVVTGRWKVRKARNYSQNKSRIPRKTVQFDGNYPVGSIIIDTSEFYLFYVLGDNKAIRYGVGVGRDGFTWSGKHKLTRKAEWPGWTPPKSMIKREAENGRILPAYMPGGPENPLGARALYIGSTIYRIHGTNQPWTIGQSMSSGCIRLTNNDIRDLYNRARIGAKIIVNH